jgi:hypothetical protein
LDVERGVFRSLTTPLMRKRKRNILPNFLMRTHMAKFNSSRRVDAVSCAGTCS